MVGIRGYLGRRRNYNALQLDFLVSSDKCPTDWEEAAESGVFFKFVQQSSSWNSARDSCRAMGGDLASVHSDAERDFVIDLADR